MVWSDKPTGVWPYAGDRPQAAALPRSVAAAAVSRPGGAACVAPCAAPSWVVGAQGALLPTTSLGRWGWWPPGCLQHTEASIVFVSRAWQTHGVAQHYQAAASLMSTSTPHKAIALTLQLASEVFWQHRSSCSIGPGTTSSLVDVGSGWCNLPSDRRRGWSRVWGGEGKPVVSPCRQQSGGFGATGPGFKAVPGRVPCDTPLGTTSTTCCCCWASCTLRAAGTDAGCCCSCVPSCWCPSPAAAAAAADGAGYTTMRQANMCWTSDMRGCVHKKDSFTVPTACIAPVTAVLVAVLTSTASLSNTASRLVCRLRICRCRPGRLRSTTSCAPPFSHSCRSCAMLRLPPENCCSSPRMP